MDDVNVPTGGFPPIYICVGENKPKKEFSKSKSLISINKILKSKK